MALTTNTRVDSNGVAMLATGNVTTDAGAAAVTTFSLGFAPRVVRFRNITDRISDEWYSGMTSPGSLNTVAAGTVILTTTAGITVSGSTFTVPSAMIPASKVFVWEAYA